MEKEKYESPNIEYRHKLRMVDPIMADAYLKKFNPDIEVTHKNQEKTNDVIIDIVIERYMGGKYTLTLEEIKSIANQFNAIQERKKEEFGENKEQEEKPTLEEIKQKLKEKGIKFFPGASYDKLYNKYING